MIDDLSGKVYQGDSFKDHSKGLQLSKIRELKK